jgi:hypothetical protein
MTDAMNIDPRTHTDPPTAIIPATASGPVEGWRYSCAYFRIRVATATVSINELERRCGLSAGYLHTALGFRETTTRKGGKVYTSRRRTIGYDLAERLAVALGLDFHAAGV